MALPLRKKKRRDLRYVMRKINSGIGLFSSVFARNASASKRRGMIEEMRDTQFRMMAHIEALDQKLATMAGRAKRQPVPVADGLLVFQLDDRYIAAPSNDYPLIRALIEDPFYEPGVSALLCRLATDKTYVIDVGANIGMHSINMARAMRVDGRLLALEPTPKTFDALRASITLNWLFTRVEARRIAAGERSGEMVLHCHPCGLWNSLFDYPGIETQQMSVPVAPLDTLVPAGTLVDLVKIDAEGAEFEILKGMQRILTEAQDISVVLEFSGTHFERVGTSPAEMIEFMAGFGLMPQLIDNHTGTLKPFDLDHVLALPFANVLFRR